MEKNIVNIKMNGIQLPDRRPIDFLGGFDTEIASSNIDSRATTTLVEITKAVKPVEKPNISKPVEKPKQKTVETPKVICESDLVGQILVQGLQSSEIPLQSQRPETAAATAYRYIPENTTVQVRATDTTKHNVAVTSKAVGCVEVQTTDTKRPNHAVDAAVRKPKTTANHAAAPNKVAWDLKKILDPKAQVVEKRPRDAPAVEKRSRDVLENYVQNEIDAKRQRITQWLQDCASKTTAAKRKASLMDKSRKDHAVKRQKMAEAKPRSTVSQPIKITVKKSNINWFIK